VSRITTGTIDNPAKPENKATLTNILPRNAISGRDTFSECDNSMKQNSGNARLKTANDGTLTVCEEWAA
jgi:hypothetical protein